MTLEDVMNHAQDEMNVFYEAYQRSKTAGHSEKYFFWRGVFHACRDAQDVLKAYGLEVMETH